jgi:hypothetical protein
MAYGEPNVLIGKVITAVYLATDKEAMKFDIQDGEPIIVRADGDCCSHSWIEAIDNPEAIIGSPVLEAEDLDLGIPALENDEYEYLQYYGFKISTVKGTCKIEYRNSSNGYYGGNLVWPDEFHYGGVFGQNVSQMIWNKLGE